MMNVPEILRAVPNFDTFLSVRALHDAVTALRTRSRAFEVRVIGSSELGVPIYHVRFGTGRLKALFVGFPHANEPIGGLTAFSLMTLLEQGQPQLIEADIEWHIVPCIDPDGAALNEGWSQQPFTLANYMRNFHRQEPCDQVECSFPIRHKGLVFDRSTVEAAALQRLLTEVRPDFYYSLHNAWTGGAWYCISRDIGASYQQQLRDLLEQHHIPLQTSPPYGEWLTRFGEGITEPFSMAKFYDFLERSVPHPEELLRAGACSWEYLAKINGSALTLLTELPYVRHPSDGSRARTTEPLRRLKLRIDAEVKFIATVILEEWARVKDEVDVRSPFHKKMVLGWIEAKDQLHEGLPSWPYKTRDLLFNPAYAGAMTEGERFDAYLMHEFWLLCHGYEFVRLLKSSSQTAVVRQSIERLESVFDAALGEVTRNVDTTLFEIVDCATLARVQLGSGLIVLNSMLEARRNAARAA